MYRENLKDKQRKTNQFEAWLESTEYVHEKYKKEINQLSSKEKKQVELLVINDASMRCAYSKNRKKQREYLYKSFRLKPSLKKMIRLIFLLDEVKLIKIKSLRLNSEKNR